MCEDWPCCGHERGCCPDYDESGRQLNMVCTCGKKLPLHNPTSICAACLSRMDESEMEFQENGYWSSKFELSDDLDDGEQEIFDIESGQE